MSNVDCAAFPQAIATAGQRKLPISDNDPTRDIPPFARALRPVLLALATAALAVLAAGTLVVLLERS